MNNQEQEYNGIIIKSEHRYKPPVIRSSCPSCGVMGNRAAGAWAYYVDGYLSAVISCDSYSAEIDKCSRTWRVKIFIEGKDVNNENEYAPSVAVSKDVEMPRITNQRIPERKSLLGQAQRIQDLETVLTAICYLYNTNQDLDNLIARAMELLGFEPGELTE